MFKFKVSHYIQKNIVCIFILLSCSFLQIPLEIFGKVNSYEQKIIEHQILKVFHHMMRSWQEEDYFSMYTHGRQESLKQISEAEFANRMVKLEWIPGNKKEDIQIKNIQIFYRNKIVIKTVISFLRINQPKTIVKTVYFDLTLQKNDWKFDLNQFINTPFFIDYEVEHGSN